MAKIDKNRKLSFLYFELTSNQNIELVPGQQKVAQLHIWNMLINEQMGKTLDRMDILL